MPSLHAIGIFSKNFGEDMSGITSFKDMKKEFSGGEKWSAIGSFFMGAFNFVSVIAPVDMVGEKIIQKGFGELASGLERKGLFHMMSDRMLGSNKIFGSGSFFGHVSLPGKRAFESGISMSERLNKYRWNYLGYNEEDERSLFHDIIIKGKTKLNDDFERRDFLQQKERSLYRELTYHQNRAFKTPWAKDRINTLNQEIDELNDNTDGYYQKMMNEMQHKSSHFYHMGLLKAEVIQVAWTGIVAKGQTSNTSTNSSSTTTNSSSTTTNSSSTTTSSIQNEALIGIFSKQTTP
jgi:hypothetical protein